MDLGINVTIVRLRRMYETNSGPDAVMKSKFLGCESYLVKGGLQKKGGVGQRPRPSRARLREDI